MRILVVAILISALWLAKTLLKRLGKKQDMCDVFSLANLALTSVRALLLTIFLATINWILLDVPIEFHLVAFPVSLSTFVAIQYGEFCAENPDANTTALIWLSGLYAGTILPIFVGIETLRAAEGHFSLIFMDALKNSLVVFAFSVFIFLLSKRWETET